MSATTSIEWTDRTWGPVRGCSRVSPGCGDSTGGGCYAERQAHRFSGPGKPYEGLTRMTEKGPRWTGKIRLVPESLDEPLRWRKPQRIFVNSMSDLFHADVPDEFIDRVFVAMALAPRHIFQVLSKRAERVQRYMAALTPERIEHAASADFGEEGAVRVANWINGWIRPRSLPDDGNPLNGTVRRWPLPNIHLGVSVENQEAADERIPLLLQTPAAVRFLSVEPLLGPVDLYEGWLYPSGDDELDCVRWVIVGGESGPGARPCDVAWIRSIVAQCKAAGVPCFVKQRGSLWYDTDLREGMRGSCAVQALDPWKWTSQRDRKGGDPSEWPEDLRVREFPAVSPTSGREGE